MKNIRILTLRTLDGKTEFVAQLGDNVKDRVGRVIAFNSEKTSPNFSSEKLANNWIKQNIN